MILGYHQAVQARRNLPYGQRPTDLHIRVMFLLARWQNASPSHAKLARAAHCHRNSVWATPYAGCATSVC